MSIIKSEFDYNQETKNKLEQRKLCYKLEILYNKYSPFIISVLLLIYHILRFLLPWDLVWLQYFCLPSVLTSIHMYNSRNTFMLCKVHRCFVNYTVCNLFACIAEHYWIIPYMNVYWFTFIVVGTVTAMLLGLYYYTVEHNKLNKGF